MLPHQKPGISNQALVFMRDVKEFASRMDILVKSAILNNTPVEKWFGPRFFVPWNFLNNLISTIWDSFHGGASLLYLFFSVTVGNNAKTEQITLKIINLLKKTKNSTNFTQYWIHVWSSNEVGQNTGLVYLLIGRRAKCKSVGMKKHLDLFS